MQTKAKLYDVVKNLLEQFPDLRNSDRLLIWQVWRKEGHFYDQYGQPRINFDDFMKATSSESVTRCRRKIQENIPELRGTEWVQKARQDIADQKGTHIYREKVEVLSMFEPDRKEDL